MAIVESKDVTRVYTSGNHELKALNGVNFTLDEGRFVVILSPSGAGKSTLLNMLDSPTSGTITVKGKEFPHSQATSLQTTGHLPLAGRCL